MTMKVTHLMRRKKKLIYLFLFILVMLLYCINMLVYSYRKLTVVNTAVSFDKSLPKKLNLIELSKLFNTLFFNDIFLLDIETLNSIQFKTNPNSTRHLDASNTLQVDTFQKIKSYLRNQSDSSVLLSFGALISSYFKISQV